MKIYITPPQAQHETDFSQQNLSPSSRAVPDIPPSDINEKEPTVEYAVHKNLLCRFSGYFSAAFEGAFNEAASQSVTFDDIDISTFGFLVNWVYTKEIRDADCKVPALCKSLLNSTQHEDYQQNSI